MVIHCASRAAAGTVISLLPKEALVPATHFRAEEADLGKETVRITVVTQLSEEQLARLRPAIDTIVDCRIH